MVRDIQLDLVTTVYGPSLRIRVYFKDGHTDWSDVDLVDIFEAYDRWKESQRG